MSLHENVKCSFCKISWWPAVCSKRQEKFNSSFFGHVICLFFLGDVNQFFLGGFSILVKILSSNCIKISLPFQESVYFKNLLENNVSNTFHCNAWSQSQKEVTCEECGTHTATLDQVQHNKKNSKVTPITVIFLNSKQPPSMTETAIYTSNTTL